MKHAVWVLLVALLLVRVPSIAQPMGPDQGIYAYIGTVILDGGLPYRDAWDQKPPGLHFAYAAMWALWSDERVVAFADLAVAAIAALLLMRLAPWFSSSRTAGPLAAGLFLLLGNPAFARLGGVRIRAQAEVFIAALVAASVLCLLYAGAAGASSRRRAWLFVGGGALVGTAALFKYPAALYLLAGWTAYLIHAKTTWGSPSPLRRLIALAMLTGTGLAIPVVLVLLAFAAGGALRDFWDATVVYNLRYSGETYPGIASFLTYLLSFPVQHARVDGLWLLGGAGSLVLLVRSVKDPRGLTLLAWTALSCVAIAINGSRGLPQYFLQALPVLALTAAVAAEDLRSRVTWRVWLPAALLAAVAVARVVSFPKAVEATLWDASRLTGRIDAATYLNRYAGRPGDKYSPPDVAELGQWLGKRTGTNQHVYVFGFSSAAYVYSRRPSASRFFWSMPLVVGFQQDAEGYGPDGLIEDLETTRPAFIVLQKDDAGANEIDSFGWFMAQPRLTAWLTGGYRKVETWERYEIWAAAAGT